MAIKLSDGEQKQIVEYYATLINERVLDNHDLFEKQLPEWHERHLGVYSSKSNKNFPFVNSADFHVPWAAFADTALESRFVAGVHNSPKLIGIEALSESAEAGSRKAENTFNYKLSKVMDLYNKICDLFQTVLVEGTGFIEIYPAETIKTVWRYSGVKKIVEGVSKFLGYEIDEGTNTLLQKKKTVKFWMPKWDNISVRDLVWEKGATTLQDAQWVARRLHLNTYQIKKKKNWKNLDKLPDDIGKVKEDETETVLNEHIGDMSAEMQLNYDKVGIWKIWGAYPFKTGKQDDMGKDIVEEKEWQFVVDIKNKIFLFDEENKLSDKRKPIVSIPCYRITGKIRGQGLPQRIGLLNDEEDTIHNIMIDNATLCNAITLLYVPNKGFDPNRIKIKPGVAIKVSHLEGVIKQFDLGNPNLDLYRLEGFVVNMLEKMGLVTDYSMGREAVERPTVRGTLALLREFNVNVNFILKNIQNGLEQAVKMTFLTLYEFMPADGIPFIGADGKEDKLMREDLENIDDMVITVLAEAIRAIKNVAMEKAGIIFDKLHQDQTGEVNTAEVKSNLVEEVDHKMVKKIIRSPKELQQIQQAQQVIAQKVEELQERESELILKEGMAEAKDYEEELKRDKVPAEEREKLVAEFRKAYIKRNMEGKNEQ